MSFVSVKFAPAGRTVAFLLPDLQMDDLLPGQQVIVNAADGPSIGTVTRVGAQLAERRAPLANSPQTVVRRATRDDIIQRLKHEQREKDAHQVAQLKIR